MRLLKGSERKRIKNPNKEAAKNILLIFSKRFIKAFYLQKCLYSLLEK